MSETININTYPIEETIAVTTVEDVTTVNVNIIQSTGAVTSVNEQTGDVVLTPSNIGALAVDGSNASSNIDLGAYTLQAGELSGDSIQVLGSNDNLKLVNGSVESGEVGLYSGNADQKIATYVHNDSLYKYANGKLVVDTVNDTIKFNDVELVDATELATKQDTLTASNTHTFVDGLTAMTTPVDADKMTIIDNSVSLAKKITWENIKATLLTYFQTLFVNKAKFISVGYTQVTGVTTTTVLASLKIPANTYVSGESFEVIMASNKTTTAVAIAFNVYHATSVNGTTNAISTSVTLSTTQRAGYLQRVLTIDGTTLRNSLPSNASGITPIAGTVVGATTTFNPAVDNWITVTVNPSVISESVGCNFITIRPI